jgi:hypothetical protein
MNVAFTEQIKKEKEEDEEDEGAERGRIRGKQ